MGRPAGEYGSALRGRQDDQLGDVALKSPEFGRLWGRHDVQAETSGTKRIVSPAVGPITISWEGLAVTSAPGQMLVTYSATPGSADETALRRVAELALRAR